MPKYIKHFTQRKLLQINEKNFRRADLLFFLKIKKKSSPKYKPLKNFYFRSRCLLNGRAKGCYSDFSLSRHMLKKMFALGTIPGMLISSW